MPGSSFGKNFSITTFGESHGVALGVVIDGCPAGLQLDEERIAKELSRRRPGQSNVVSPRQEKEDFEVLSGVFEGKTTGHPICIVVRNSDVKSKDYDNLKDRFRPGHADFTYFSKYGFRDHRGGGRSSARETVGRVIAGAVAKQLLESVGVLIRGGVVQIGALRAEKYSWSEVESNELRSVDPDKVEQMRALIAQARKERDSVGGVVEVQAIGCPVGLGEPVFSKLEAVLAQAMMSIPAVKGVEIGEGFASAQMRGSQMNDLMRESGFASNHHGGILGGLSSGEPIVVRLALKPTSSLPQQQPTVNTKFENDTVTTLGRHDPCVAIRAVPIAEAMLALVLVDLWMEDAASRALQQHFFARAEIDYPKK